MLVGHFAAAFGAKRIAPTLSLGTLVFAALLADVLAFSLVADGVERFRIATDVQRNRFVGENIAYSHSLLMDVLWGVLFASAYFLLKRQSRGAFLLFGAVLSHWVLDVMSHRPDMPLAPGDATRFGLGLWNSIPAALIVEGGLWALSIGLYLRVTRAATPGGKYAFWAGAVILTLAWVSNLTAPPRGGGSAASGALASLAFFACAIAWAYWMNRARAVQV